MAQHVVSDYKFKKAFKWINDAGFPKKAKSEEAKKWKSELKRILLEGSREIEDSEISSSRNIVLCCDCSYSRPYNGKSKIAPKDCVKCIYWAKSHLVEKDHFCGYGTTERVKFDD